jgi:CBS domain-containing protein
MNDYSIIKVYTSERARYEGRALAQAVQDYIRSLKIASRCVILRGIEGCYENGRTANTAIVDLSYDMPLIIEIILPSADRETVLKRLDAMVLDGIVAVVEASVVSHKTAASLVPHNLRIRDVMTVSPICAHNDFSVRSAVELMLDRGLKCLPVIDSDNHCVGIITQSDLSNRANMPLRLGLLSSLSSRKREEWLSSCEALRCEEIMSRPPALIKADAKLADAIRIMNKEGRKRLPVIDDQARVVGILSRIDILRAIAASASPDTSSELGGGSTVFSRYVEGIKDRDMLSILDSTGLKAAIDTLIAKGAQRAAVVDADGRLVGIITDKILLQALGGQIGGFWPFGIGKKLRRAARPVSDIMERALVTATENMSIYEVLRLMTEHGLKRIPVVDSKAVFTGMIRRDSILLAFSRLWESDDSSHDPIAG